MSSCDETDVIPFELSIFIFYFDISSPLNLGSIISS